MKLWLKVSLISVSVLLLTVAICSFLLLGEAKDNIFALAKERAEEKQRNLQAAFYDSVRYYSSYDLPDMSSEEIIKYCFGHFADEETVLALNDQIVYSTSELDPIELMGGVLPTGNAQQTHIKTVDEKSVLIVESRVSLPGGEYAVYVVQDITGIYESVSAMAVKFTLISGVCILLGTALIVFLVRRATRPVGQLGDTARRFAAGEYDARAKVSPHDDIGFLAKEFNSMADEIQRHIRELEKTAGRQKLLIGGLTHEFKTPMTSLLIHSDMLMGAKMRDEDKFNALSHIHEQIRRLERLTQDMAKLITTEQAIAVREESIPALFERVGGDMRELLQQRNTPLICDCKRETLPVNAELMHSLLMNLIDNASKASECGQAIQLVAHDNIIEVSDNGCGIPVSEIARVTEPFYMVDKSRSKKQGGFGLGLALAKRIAEAHGAKLCIKSGVGAGTTISIVFPR